MRARDPSGQVRGSWGTRHKSPEHFQSTSDDRWYEAMSGIPTTLAYGASISRKYKVLAGSLMSP